MTSSTPSHGDLDGGLSDLSDLSDLSQRLDALCDAPAWEPLWRVSLDLSARRDALLQAQIKARGALQGPINALSLLESRLRAALLSLPPRALDRLAISARTRHLSELVHTLNTSSQAPIIDLAHGLLMCVHELRLLKRLAAHALGLKEPYQADLINEVFSLGETERVLSTLQDAGLHQRFQHLYHEGLEREVRYLERELVSLEGEERLWGLALWASDLQVSISSAPSEGVDELISRCASARATLRDRINERWLSLSEEARLTLLNDRAWAMLHHSSDLLGRVDPTELAPSVKKLACVLSDVEWLLEHAPATRAARKALKVARPHLLSAFEQLKKKEQIVRAELQEKRLQGRLEGIFGHTFVRRFEQLIFALILLVLALLFFELMWVDPEDHALRRTLALIDTAICFVFLLEFGVKLSLSDNKRFYFQRRWFVDLLPSIPFVLFTDVFLLDHLVSARGAKLTQLSRLVRYIRIARPFIRAIRLISFTLRGLDRLVRRYAPWLNQNLVFFEPHQEIHRRPPPTSFEESHQAYGRALHHLRQVMIKLTDPAESVAVMSAYVQLLDKHLDWERAPIALGVLSSQGEPRRKRDVPVEQAIYTLLHIEGAQLEAHLGSEFPKHLYTVVGLFDIPIVRSLPLIRLVLERRRNSPAASDFSAWMVRGVGRVLELLMTTGYWFADLYGIITGPKLVDRVGSALVRSFERPAKRLLIIGGFFLIAHILVSALDVPFFSPMLSLFQRLFGLPVIIIGGICLVPLMVGTWMTRLAGQATELYRLTSEAQYINLLKEVKESRGVSDLRLLYRRVLSPELKLLGLDSPEHFNAFIGRASRVMSARLQNDPDLMRELQTSARGEGGEGAREAERLHKGQQSLGAALSEEDAVASFDSTLWWLEDKTLMLYRDYLDGALLHESDVKTTEQLLGNIALRNLFLHKLDLTKREVRDLERLDLSAHRSLFGPYMWFNLITQSVSHNTAQLLLDYNRFVIPLRSLPRRPEHAQRLYQQWRATKGFGEVEVGLSLEDKTPFTPPFQTSEISSLHLLTSLHQYEPMLKARFGEEVFEMLLNDQRRLIRGVFSSYPLHSLPRAQRTLNPYQLYQEYLFGGRVFTLPFRLVGMGFKLLGLGVRWMKQKIDEIRFPEQQGEPVIAQKDFVVAKRKIDRMRKPIYMKVMQLRARLDYEYLGLSVDGELSLGSRSPELGGRAQALFEEDLEYINAIAVERLAFKQRRDEVSDLIRELRELLARHQLLGEGLSDHLRAHYPSLERREREVTRALTMAYMIDYKGIQSYTQALSRLKELVDDTLRSGDQRRSFKLHKHVLTLSGRAADRLVSLGDDKEHKGFNVFWGALGLNGASDEDKKRCWRRYLSDMRDLKPLLCVFGEHPPLPIREVLEDVIRYTESWTNELVTLRTLQTLSVMDVQNYRSYIWHIGDYAQDETEVSRDHAERTLYARDALK